MQTLLCLILLAAVAPLTGRAQVQQPAGEAPEMESVRQLFAKQNYPEVLREVGRLLTLRGPAAAELDRFELFTLRGEASLRTKSNVMAADAFKAAAGATQDPRKQATARATELLIRRCKPAGYLPRSAPKPAASDPPAPRNAPRTAIPILEDDDRKAALEALLNDELAAAEPKLKAARAATTLPPVIEAAQLLSDVRVLELAARGSDEQTKTLAADLGTHAHQLISPALRSMSASAERIWAVAGAERYATDRRGVRAEKLYGLQGLDSTQQNELKNIVSTVQKIAPVARDLATVTASVELNADAQAAQALLERATEVLTYDYNNAGRYNPGQTR